MGDNKNPKITKNDLKMHFLHIFKIIIFNCGHATLFKPLSIRPSVHRYVGPSFHPSAPVESVKTHMSAPANPSTTGIGHMSGLVHFILKMCKKFQVFLGHFWVLIGPQTLPLAIYWSKLLLELTTVQISKKKLGWFA